MKEKWLQDIHDRMANYEAEPPEGLWEGIEQHLGDIEPKAESRPRRATVVPMWARRAAGVAAMVAVAWLVGQQFVGEPAEADRRKSLSAMAQPAAEAEETAQKPSYEATPAAPLDNLTKAVRRGQRRLAAAFAKQADVTLTAEASTSAADTATTTAEKHNEAAAERNQAAAEKPNQADRQQPASQPKKPGHTRQQPVYMAQAASRRGQEGRITLAAYSSGSTRGFSFADGGDAAIVGTGRPEDATWADSPMLGLVASNQGQHVETTTKHHLPARLGLTVAYNLTDRLALETGLAYTCLSSDQKSGSRENYLQSEQRLEYVGIPLSAKYRLGGYKALQLYASAGVMAEKCVSGTVDKTYVFDGATQATEQADISDRPMQFSASAGVGLQLSLSKAVGLYAEPGLRYNFADGSDLKTYYSAHPVNFNLNLGLRLSLGK